MFQLVERKVKVRISEFNDCEQELIGEIKKTYRYLCKPYMFWFNYDVNNLITWQGGVSLPMTVHFRNTFTLTIHGEILRNWEDI